MTKTEVIKANELIKTCGKYKKKMQDIYENCISIVFHLRDGGEVGVTERWEDTFEDLRKILIERYEKELRNLEDELEGMGVYND